MIWADALPLFGEHFGTVLDNPDFLFMPLRVPFGGRKASGWILERQEDTWVERDGAFIYSRELARGVRTEASLPERTPER
jgi:hypothetical protein